MMKSSTALPVFPVAAEDADPNAGESTREPPPVSLDMSDWVLVGGNGLPSMKADARRSVRSS